jgi:hypothetical protein
VEAEEGSDQVPVRMTVAHLMRSSSV